MNMRANLIGAVKNLSLMAGSIVAVALVIELSLHCLYFLDLFPDYPAIVTRLEKLRYAEPVSVYLFTDNVPRNGPGFRTYMQRGIPRQLIEFSEDGMRLDAFEGPALCTVGMFGDSLLEALQVGRNEDLSSLTEADLRENGYSVNFQNYGMGGYGTTAEFIRYNQLFEAGHKFDQVVLFFYPGNDVANNSRALNGGESGRYPYFVIDSGQLRRDDSEGSGLRTDRMWVLREFLAKYSHLSNIVMNADTRLVTLPKIRSSTMGAFDPNPDKSWRDAWEVTEKVLESWKQDLTNHGTKFVVVMLVTMGQLSGSINETDGLEENYANERLRKFTTDHNIDYIDMLPIAKQYIRENNLDFPYLSWQYDGHYSHLGHRLVSGALIEYFRENQKQCRDDKMLIGIGDSHPDETVGRGGVSP
jgi:hypothetical protein